MNGRVRKLILEEFRDICVLEKEQIEFCGIDHSRYYFEPEIVIRPKEESSVERILKLAYKENICITVRGGGTGCCGGALPVCGGIVLDLSRLDGIRIDENLKIAEVGAGAITNMIDMEAGRYGLMYPPDPSSHKYCTIGGNIACNAGGLRAAKYGVTKDYVISMVVYLADGTRLELGKNLKKMSVGPNLKDFFIGSEGTFGVIVSAKLRLIKRPEKRKTVLAFFDSEGISIEVSHKIMESGLNPCILEYMDGYSLYSASRYCDKRVDGEALLLIEFDGNEREINSNICELKKILKGFKFFVSDDEEEAEEFWMLRRKCSQAMYLLGNSKINQDIALPIGSEIEFLRFFKELGIRKGLKTPVFGHVADGNYHIHIMYDSLNSKEKGNAYSTMDEAILKVISLGGAVSGEHGIGLTKSRYMKYQHDKNALKVMKRLKKAFDGKSILNCGKLYEDFDIRKYSPKVGVKLPWDK